MGAENTQIQPIPHNRELRLIGTNTLEQKYSD